MEEAPELDGRTLKVRMFNDGYIVLHGAVARPRCEAVLQAIGDDLGVRLDDPPSWRRVSAEVDQVPLWGHQAQWDIRQDPAIHKVWSGIWGTDRLWADRNSCRFSPPRHPDRPGAEPLRLHWDVDPRDRTNQWYPGILALTDAGPGEGGFRCAPHCFTTGTAGRPTVQSGRGVASTAWRTPMQARSSRFR